METKMAVVKCPLAMLKLKLKLKFILYNNNTGKAGITIMLFICSPFKIST